MAKRSHIRLAILVAAIAGGFIWLLVHIQEPVYQGKDLSFWLEQYGSNHWTHPGREPDLEAQTALRHIGTNAAPIYLRMIATKELRLKKKLMQLVPKRLQARLHIPDILTYESELDHRRRLGTYGFTALGGDAAPFVPALAELLNDKDPGVRAYASFVLRGLGPSARAALPELIKHMKDSNATVQFDAVWSVGQIHERPEQVVPVLIDLLKSPDASRRFSALLVLGKFGPAAKAAAPLVADFLKASDEGVRSQATNTLKAIDPEAAAKAGVK